MLQGDEGGKERARNLRATMSLPELLLWRVLRSKSEGLKFRKQHPSGPYTADFYCHEARLVVEVDGIAHEMGDNPARDIKRDAWFATRDIHVLRVSAKDILRDVTAAADAIAVYAKNLPPSGEHRLRTK